MKTYKNVHETTLAVGRVHLAPNDTIKVTDPIPETIGYAINIYVSKGYLEECKTSSPTVDTSKTDGVSVTDTGGETPAEKVEATPAVKKGPEATEGVQDVDVKKEEKEEPKREKKTRKKRTKKAE